MTIISPYFTFPPITWWSSVINAGTVIFDTHEHFQKMTDRNRYLISGANNSIKLSVPLINGRNQRIPVNEVCIYNDARWQVQHWRTLISVYKRSPYFDHYEDSLKPLFQTPCSHLTHFNRASIHWVKQQLNIHFEEKETTVFLKEYPGKVTDLRFHKPVLTRFPKYYQVFQDRIGFLPDLSILDLLFSEGPRAIDFLRLLPE